MAGHTHPPRLQGSFSDLLLLSAATKGKFAEAKAAVAALPPSTTAGADVEVIPFGTGSAVPTMARNGSFVSLSTSKKLKNL